MPFLRGLRFFQRHLRIGEIGAGILAVRVEKQVIQLARYVVMMGDVSARACDAVHLRQAAAKHSREPLQLVQQGVPAVPIIVENQYLKHVRDRAALNRQTAIHIGFAEHQFRLDPDPERRQSAVQPDRGLRSALAVNTHATVRPNHGQPPIPDETR